MPCRDEGYEPGPRQIRSKKVAQHLIYVYDQLKKLVPADVLTCAKDYYGNEKNLDKYTADLCRFLNSMTDKDRERIVYNAHSKEARKLADWWEAHQEADRKRKEEEDQEHKKKELAKQARNKLTPEERQALGLKE